MTRSSSAGNSLAEISWPDATLVSITADYDAVILVIRESGRRLVRVVCDGHIGFELVGFWDETIIERANLDASGPFLARCLANVETRHGPSPPATGNAPRNGADAFQLVITLIDGAQLSVAASGIRTETISD